HGCDGIGVGVIGGRGSIEQCEIFENRIGGMDLTGRSETSIKHCKIHDIPSDSERRAGLSAAPMYHDITTGYDPGLDGRQFVMWGAFWGLRITDGSMGIIEDVDAFANGGMGILAMSGASPTIRNSRAYNNMMHGINALRADASFENVE